MTEERKYSVGEIDDLRCAIENKYLFGRYSFPQNVEATINKNYYPNEKVKFVEETVRTHMLAGHIAQDSFDSEDGTI